MRHKTALEPGDDIVVNGVFAKVDNTTAAPNRYTRVFYFAADSRPGQFTLPDVQIAAALGFSTGMDRPPEFQIGDHDHADTQAQQK